MAYMKDKDILLWATGVLLFLQGCASGPGAHKSFLDGDYPIAIHELRPQKEGSKPGARNYVLANMNCGSAAIYGGDDVDAFSAFSNASEAIRDVGGGKLQGAASLWTHESIKNFKGEPFEKGMANIYLGILYWRKGELDNARACFSQAFMADSASAPEYCEDFSLADYLMGRCYMYLGEQDNAAISFNRAKKYWPENPYLSTDANKDSNVIAVIELGVSPVKGRKGIEGCDDYFQKVAYPEGYAVLSADGKKVADSSQILDLYKQADTRGKSVKDVTQKAKGVFALLVRIAIMVFSGGHDPGNIGKYTGSIADIRQWWYLPGEVHIIACKMEPGEHTINLSFYTHGASPSLLTAPEKSFSDYIPLVAMIKMLKRMRAAGARDPYFRGAGEELVEYRQVWHRVPVYGGKQNIWLLRSVPMLQCQLVKSDAKDAKPLKAYMTKEARTDYVMKTLKMADKSGK